MVAVIDYDAGNIKSVENALKLLGEEVRLTRDAADLQTASHIILPGVGSFGDAMERLHGYSLVEGIREIVKSGKPFLGICLGLQLLFEESEESPGVKGLGLLKGAIRRIPEGEDLKIPHIGWNDLTFPNPAKLFSGIPEHTHVYFVHSYYLDAADRSIVAANTMYGVRIDAAIESGNLCACQFHPEKSADAGLRILQSFLR